MTDWAWPLERRFGEVVVGADPEALDLVFGAGEAGQDQDRRFHLGDAQRAQHLEAGHIGQVEIKQNDIVIVELSEINTFLAEVGRIDVEAFGLQHQFDRPRRRGVVLNQQNAHAKPPCPRIGPGRRAMMGRQGIRLRTN
jgi:hypothetical protein